jgi:hypothetical protein
MQVLASPSLTPTSQHAGTTSDNSAAMTAQPHPEEIPVSSPRPQPHTGLPFGAVAWQPLAGAK